jgi:hypothetical protein
VFSKETEIVFLETAGAVSVSLRKAGLAADPNSAPAMFALL